MRYGVGLGPALLLWSSIHIIGFSLMSHRVLFSGVISLDFAYCKLWPKSPEDGNPGYQQAILRMRQWRCLTKSRAQRPAEAGKHILEIIVLIWSGRFPRLWPKTPCDSSRIPFVYKCTSCSLTDHRSAVFASSLNFIKALVHAACARHFPRLTNLIGRSFFR